MTQEILKVFSDKIFSMTEEELSELQSKVTSALHENSKRLDDLGITEKIRQIHG